MSETTAVDWRTMPAGREMDELVAARVFREPKKSWWRQMWWGERRYVGPRFSSDFGFAFEVEWAIRDRCREGEAAPVEAYFFADAPMSFDFPVPDAPVDTVEYYCAGEAFRGKSVGEAALALCRVALLAVESEPPVRATPIYR